MRTAKLVLGVAVVLGSVGCGGDSVGIDTADTGETGDACVPGTHSCPCTADGGCDPGLTCVVDIWTCASETPDPTSPTSTSGEQPSTSGASPTTGDDTTDATTGDDTMDATTDAPSTTDETSTTGEAPTTSGLVSTTEPATDSTVMGSTSVDPESSGGTDGEEDICRPAGLGFESQAIDADDSVVVGVYSASAGYFDVALDSTHGRVYLSRGGDDEVEVVDLGTGASATIATGNSAEHLYYDPSRDEVVVSLPVAAHSAAWDDADQEGCIASIDADAVALDPPWWIPLDPWDVVSDGSGHAYAAGASGQWTSGVAIALDDGEHALHVGNSLRAGTNIDIHPSHDRIYGADNGISPDDIERYDIAGTSMTYADDSPYHGDYPMCGDLRVHPSGNTIYTACGHVFQATNVLATDMTWTGDISLPWWDIAFAPDGDLAFVVMEGAPVLFIVDTATLQGVGTYTMSGPVQRVLAGPDYLVLVRDVLGGAPYTELEVVAYADVTAPPYASPEVEIDDDTTVNAGSYAAGAGFFDAVLDTERGRVFLSRGLEEEVEVLDLTGGASATLPTAHRAEHMHFDPILDEVVIALPIDDHSLYWWDEDQEGYVGSIDAETLSVSAPRWMPLDPWQLVSDGTGVAHIGGASGQWTSAITVDLATGWFRFHVGSSVRNGTNIRIHPDLDRIYGADNGLSPSDIERWDILGDYLEYATDSPYHGDYPMCGDLRLHPDGGLIYTRCGHIFVASNVAGFDMTWTADLGVEWLDLVLDPSGMTAYVITEGSPTITSYDTATLAEIDTTDLLSDPVRLLAGPSYLVALRPTGGGTTVEVLPY